MLTTFYNKYKDNLKKINNEDRTPKIINETSNELEVCCKYIKKKTKDNHDDDSFVESIIKLIDYFKSNNFKNEKYSNDYEKYKNLFLVINNANGVDEFESIPDNDDCKKKLYSMAKKKDLLSFVKNHLIPDLTLLINQYSNN